MNWYQHHATVDRLAAAYVLGTLQGSARQRFEAMLQHKTLLRLAVDDWTQRLGPLLMVLPPVEPSRALWKAVAQRTAVQTGAKPEPLWRRIFSAIPAGALAMGVLVGVTRPPLPPRE